jgi:hypothetical protein
LEKQLGPEYLALVDALFNNNNNTDLNSKDFEEIVSMSTPQLSSGLSPEQLGRPAD